MSHKSSKKWAVIATLLYFTALAGSMGAAWSLVAVKNNPKSSSSYANAIYGAREQYKKLQELDEKIKTASLNSTDISATTTVENLKTLGFPKISGSGTIKSKIVQFKIDNALLSAKLVNINDDSPKERIKKLYDEYNNLLEGKNQPEEADYRRVEANIQNSIKYIKETIGRKLDALTKLGKKYEKLIEHLSIPNSTFNNIKKEVDSILFQQPVNDEFSHALTLERIYEADKKIFNTDIMVKNHKFINKLDDKLTTATNLKSQFENILDEDKTANSGKNEKVLEGDFFKDYVKSKEVITIFITILEDVTKVVNDEKEKVIANFSTIAYDENTNQAFKRVSSDINFILLNSNGLIK